MKIVFLNTSERTGGAAIAANRLAKALRKAGAEVSMLVRDRQTDDPQVVALHDTYLARRLDFLRFAWERLVIFVANGFRRKRLFQVSIANTGADVSRHPLVVEADVIHLHWVNQGFLSLRDIERLIRLGKPIVWTMHDMWAATGICHYPDTCTRYQTFCSACPMQPSFSLCDLARIVYRRKQKMRLPEITYVGCSRWIMEKAQKSALLKGASFRFVPNPIDQVVFRPLEKKAIRKKWGLKEDCSLILFAAAKLSDERKGVAYFIEACGKLNDEYAGTLEIVLMGGNADELAGRFPFPVNKIGYLSNAGMMAEAYSAADIFVIPSLEDNLPNTVMEAMACGTPCVGFDIGGIPEMIDHKRNGYIARYKDAADLAEGIKWVLEHPDPLQLREACIQKTSLRYTETVVARQYLALYTELLNSSI